MTWPYNSAHVIAQARADIKKLEEQVAAATNDDERDRLQRKVDEYRHIVNEFVMGRQQGVGWGPDLSDWRR